MPFTVCVHVARSSLLAHQSLLLLACEGRTGELKARADMSEGLTKDAFMEDPFSLSFLSVDLPWSRVS